MSGEDANPPYNPFLGGIPTTTRPESLDPESVQTAMAEAQNRPLDFDPKTRAQFIRDSVRGIKAALAEDITEAELRQRFSSFMNAYPELYRKLVAGEDLSNLTAMLAMLDQMSQGNLTHHQASMIVGTRLAERYLPHNLRPSQQARR